MLPDEKKAVKKAIKNLSSTASNGATLTEKTIAREELLEELIVGMIGDRDEEINSLRRALSILKNEAQESAYETPEMIELTRAFYAKMNALYFKHSQQEAEGEIEETNARNEYHDEMKRLKAKALLQIADEALRLP